LEEKITEGHFVEIEICNYLQKKMVLYLAVFVVKILCRVFSNFRRVFGKTLFYEKLLLLTRKIIVRS